MAFLKIFLFGSPRVFRSDREEEIQLTRNVQAFLAFLLLNRHRVHPREVLADLFWGDRSEMQARNCLNTMVWKLRCILEMDPVPRGTYLLRTPLGEVGLNRKCDFWLDIAFFEEQISAMLKKPIESIEHDEAEKLDRVLDLYVGELLEGFYHDWALLERERMRSLYLKALEHQMFYYRHHGHYERAISCGKKILKSDNLREEIHREIIRYYADCGLRSQALLHYKDCCEILNRELGIQPMEETQILFKQINSTGRCPPSASNLCQFDVAPDFEAKTGLELVLNKLKLVMGEFETMNKKIAEITKYLERTIKA